MSAPSQATLQSDPPDCSPFWVPLMFMTAALAALVDPSATANETATAAAATLEIKVCVVIGCIVIPIHYRSRTQGAGSARAPLLFRR